MSYEIFLTPPSDFSPAVEVSSCYLDWDQKVLFLRRHPSRPQGGTWGVPAGKLEKGESPKQALIREVWEEIGLDIQQKTIQEIRTLFIRIPHMDYVYHMFLVRLDQQPELQLGLEEHEEARWVTCEDALELPLIKGAQEALKYYREAKS